LFSISVVADGGSDTVSQPDARPAMAIMATRATGHALESDKPPFLFIERFFCDPIMRRTLWKAIPGRFCGVTPQLISQI